MLVVTNTYTRTDGTVHTVHFHATVDPYLSGLHLYGGSDYPDTKFSRDSHFFGLGGI